MFKNSGIITRVQHALNPTVLVILVTAVCLFLIIWAYSRHRRDTAIIKDVDLYAEAIYDYVINISSINDRTADVITHTFKYDNTLLPASGDKSWNDDSEAFGEVILKMQNIAILTSIKTSSYYKNEEFWNKMVPFFIKTVDVPTAPVDFNTPWGSNWYQFSITYPRFLTILAYLYRRLFGKPNDDLELTLANYIASYFSVPRNGSPGIESMGWHRDGPNAVMMAVPYVGGKLLMKTLDNDDPIIRYVKEYLNLDFVSSGEGLYPDYSFIFHTSLRAYGYVYSADEDFIILNRFFRRSTKRLYDIYNILEHPTIPLHFSAFFTRTASCKSAKRGKLGFYVLNTARIVVAKTPNWYLSFNGQINNLCYYEADKSENLWVQIWLTGRIFLYQNSDTRWYKELVTYYPGVISYKNSLEVFLSETKTTHTFLPSRAKSIICKFGDSAIAMRNSYIVAKNGYDLTVDEMILITEKGYHVHYKIIPDWDRHTQEPIVLSLNLGREGEKKFSPSDKFFKYVNNTTFIYGAATPIISYIKHPVSSDILTSLQVNPKKEFNHLEASFSTIHTDVNEIVGEPTNNLIATHNFVMHYDESEPDYLWLYNVSTKTVAVGKFTETYRKDISIPASMITSKFGVEALKGQEIYKDSIIGIVDNTGNQILISNAVVPNKQKH